MWRPFKSLAVISLMIASIGVLPTSGQEKSETKSDTKTEAKKTDTKFDAKNPTADQIAESVVFIYGRREFLQQIRRNGVERGRLTRIADDGRTEETTYERRFVRGENSGKDKIRIDQKMPTMAFSLIYGEGRTWGLINGSAFTPRQEATASFLSEQWHGLDALLRYKENGSTVALINREKQKGLDLYVLDLTDKEKRVTRYYISAKTLHVLWLEYEQAPTDGAKPVKYMKKYADYRYAQGTLVPYNTRTFENDKQTQEQHILTVTFGVKMDDALFQNPETQTTTAAQP
ncbi:MAG TPA: hypothetical protein VGO91_04210 [Pyrinomonadaceae bacterium]|nr:hypothetical protein [Pyrinomonadaceae bacterium]